MDADQSGFAVEMFPSSMPPSDCGLVTLSPDSDRFACVRPISDTGLMGVWISPVQPVDLQPVMLRQEFQAISLLAWSPDGERLAFVSCEGLPPGTDHRLWVIDAAVGNIVAPRLIYSAQGPLAALSWSPDGVLLAVADGSAGVIVCTEDGERVMPVDGEAMRYPLGPNCMAWMGSSLLAYVKLSPDEGGLWLTDLDAGETRQVLSLGADEVAIPAWTGGQVWGALRGGLGWPAEGCTLYIWRDLQDDPAIYPLLEVTFDPTTALFPSNDGDLWAFTAWVGGRRAVWVVSLPSGDAQTLDLSRPVDELVGWIEDPRRLLVTLLPGRLDGEIERMQGNSEADPSEEIFALDFTPAELALVGRLLDAPSLQLPKDPFDGSSAEEIERALTQAQESLADRRYIQVQPDATVAVDVSVAALVGALAFPESSLIATLMVGEEPPETRQVHFASGLIVEQEQQHDDTYSLTAVRDRETASRRLCEFLRLVDQPASSGEAFALAEAEMGEVRLVVAAEGERAGAVFLEQAGVPSATAASLAQALANSLRYATLLALTWRGGEAQQVDSFALLEGGQGLWLLRPLGRDGESWIKVTPSDASYAIRQVEELTRLVMPVLEE